MTLEKKQISIFPKMSNDFFKILKNMSRGVIDAAEVMGEKLCDMMCSCPCAVG